MAGTIDPSRPICQCKSRVEHVSPDGRELMTSTRAQGVAEVLWELKRAAKIGAFTPVARRAGFSAGSKGRAMMTCMKSVRRDWPHLEWWRAVPDDGKVEKNSEHANMLIEAGFDISDDEADEEKSVVADFEEQVMSWDEEETDEAAEAEETAGKA